MIFLSTVAMLLLTSINGHVFGCETSAFSAVAKDSPLLNELSLPTDCR